MPWAHGHFYWNELMSRDSEKSKSFYGDVLGWTFDGMDMGPGGTYWVCKDGDKPVGGIFQMGGPDFEGMPDHWFAYIAVNDIDATVDRIKAEGGEILRETFDVPGVGRIALAKDSTGAAAGYMTPEQPSDS